VRISPRTSGGMPLSRGYATFYGGPPFRAQRSASGKSGADPGLRPGTQEVDECRQRSMSPRGAPPQDEAPGGGSRHSRSQAHQAAAHQVRVDQRRPAQRDTRASERGADRLAKSAVPDDSGA